MILNLVTAEPHKFSATIAVTYPAGATCKLVNNDTSEEETATTTTGSYTFKATKGGSYKVVAIENGGDQRTAQSDNFTVSDGGSYSKTLVFPEVQFSATVGVVFPAGLTCSLTDGTTTLYSSGTSGTYNFTVPNTGTWTASASGCQSQSVNVTTKGASYSLRLRANVTVTITGNNATVTYDGASHSVSGYSVSINKSTYKESDFTFSGSSSVSRTSAGTSNMGLSATKFTNNNDNYNVTFKVTDGYLKINQKSVTVQADNKSKQKGKADPALTATITGRVSTSHTISYTISRASGENVGTYTITPRGDASQGNYYVTFKTGTFTITAPPATTGTIVATGGYGIYMIVGDDDTQVVGNGATWTNLSPGSYTVAYNPGNIYGYREKEVTVVAGQTTNVSF